MKKFFLFLVRCSCIFMLCYVLFIILLVMFYTNKNITDSYIASDFDKHNRLIQISSPKIVFIGGSNIAFGLHSELIKDSLHIEPVNMGISAGIGLKYMLKEVIPHLKTKDILVIIPEYEQFSPKLYCGEETLSELLMIKKEWKELVFQTDWVVFPSSLISRVITDIIYHFTNKATPERYSRIKFNEYGDYIGHWQFKHHLISAPPITSSFSPKVIEDIKGIILQLEHKGVKIYLMPPCYHANNYSLDSQRILSIQKELQKQGIPFLSNPERYVFNDSLFYDTQYHLTKEGGLIRTQRLIEDLKRK